MEKLKRFDFIDFQSKEKPTISRSPELIYACGKLLGGEGRFTWGEGTLVEIT